MMKTIFIQSVTALCLLFAGCDAGQPKQNLVPAPLTGIDHLAGHLSVQNFWVNGASGHQAGKGGSVVCCVKLPRQWRADLTVIVEWNITNWRDCGGERFKRRVSVEPYDKVGHLRVHFLGDGSVRVVSSDIGPGIFEPNADYPGPHDPIPKKNPWHAYGDYGERCPSRQSPIFMEPAQ